MSPQPEDLTAATPSAEPDAWAGQARISRQLATWSVVSIVGGSATAAAGHIRGDRAIRAFGAQNAAWGAVDLLIAAFGETRRRGRLATVEDPHHARVQDGEWRSLRRILLVNAGLDLGYVAAGMAGLAWSLGRAQHPLPAMAGHSAAVAVQGGFLLIFDAVHARRAGRAVGGVRATSGVEG